VRHEPIVQKAVGIGLSDEDNRSTVTAITAIRPGKRLILFTADASGTVATVTALDMNGYAIDKISHYLPYSLRYRYIYCLYSTTSERAVHPADFKGGYETGNACGY
jgi:hypothetical protein